MGYKIATRADVQDLGDPENPACWAYRGWCLSKGIHYTEAWHPSETDAFLRKWNEFVRPRTE